MVQGKFLFYLISSLLLSNATRRVLLAAWQYLSVIQIPLGPWAKDHWHLFLMTQDYKKALKHQVVLVYPYISGKVFSSDVLKALAAHPRNQGTLIGVQVLGGGLNETFGFSKAVSSSLHTQIILNTKHPLTREFQEPREQKFVIGSQGHSVLNVYSYSQSASPIATYPDSSAAVIQRDFEDGRAVGLGFDLGYLLALGYNNRQESLSRSYVSQFEPHLDVLLRQLKAIYRAGEPGAVTLGTVSFNQKLAVVITHDIDYSRSLKNILQYAALEKSLGIPATYFIQTKYIEDFNDKIFFNPEEDTDRRPEFRAS